MDITFAREIILTYLRKYYKLVFLSIVIWAIIQAGLLFIPYGMGQIVALLSHENLDQLLQILIIKIAVLTQFPDSNLLSLSILLGLIFIVTIMIIPITLGFGYWFPWEISIRIHNDLRSQVVAKILTLPLSFYDTNNPGRLATLVTKGVENYALNYEEFLSEIMPKLIKVFGIFMMIIWIEWKVALFFILSFLFILIFSSQKLRQIIKKEDIVESSRQSTDSHTSEIITNIKTVKAFATEQKEMKRQQQRLKREFKINSLRINKSYVNLSVWQSVIINLCFFIVLIFALIPTVQGEISLGHFITTITITRMAYEEVEPINYFAEMFTGRYASIKRLHEFLNRSEGKDAINVLSPSTSSISSQLKDKLEFKNLSFSYDGKSPVLKNINFQIEPCQTVALVGHSGSGKSTLVKLLFRYFEPNTGQILMNGKDIQSLEVAPYRQNLAIVHQDVEIFNGTIRDNLIYGNPQVSLEDLQKACSIAQLNELIEHLPEGLGTKVGERGVRLSGGQKQRLGIARALLVKPDILIFDEATSSLDYESEHLIQLAMKSIRGTCSMLIIAHRLSTVRDADKIVVMDNGQIIEIGTHEELLLEKGIYHRLHSLQETGDLI